MLTVHEVQRRLLFIAPRAMVLAYCTGSTGEADGNLKGFAFIRLRVDLPKIVPPVIRRCSTHLGGILGRREDVNIRG